MALYHSTPDCPNRDPSPTGSRLLAWRSFHWLVLKGAEYYRATWPAPGSCTRPAVLNMLRFAGQDVCFASPRSLSILVGCMLHLHILWLRRVKELPSAGIPLLIGIQGKVGSRSR